MVSKLINVMCSGSPKAKKTLGVVRKSAESKTEGTVLPL